VYSLGRVQNSDDIFFYSAKEEQSNCRVRRIGIRSTKTEVCQQIDSAAVSSNAIGLLSVLVLE